MSYQKYKYRKYEANFIRLYGFEKRKLLKIIPKNAKIEHVGSTAVPGLGGKGIIDIIIAVPRKDIKKLLSVLENEGFEYKPKPRDYERKFLQKIVRVGGKERRVHIQLTWLNSKVWKSHLAVRDILCEDKNLMDEYARIKKEAVKHADGKGKKYREYKERFLKNLEKMAIRKFN